MKPSVSVSIVAVFLVSLLVFPTLAVQQSVQVISSHGMIKSPISWLHTDGAYIKNEDGEIVSLRGCAFIEAAYRIDESLLLERLFLGLKDSKNSESTMYVLK